MVAVEGALQQLRDAGCDPARFTGAFADQVAFKVGNGGKQC